MIMHISSLSLPNASDSSEKAERRRASNRRGAKRRDHVLLAAMRKAEAAALPPRKQPDDRPCLGCGRWFASEWCGNRLCDNCKRKDDEA